MNKMVSIGALIFGVAVFLSLGAFGVGEDTMAVLFTEAGLSAESSSVASRFIAAALFVISIGVQAIGWNTEEGRDVSHEEFLAAKAFVEHQEKQRQSQ